MSQTEPNNKEAEEKLIACCCIDGTPDVFNSISNIITEDDFYYLKTKLLFKSVQHLVNSSTPIDSISIMEYLKSIECLDEVDGVYGIEEIVGSTTTSMQVKYLANVILDKSKLRTLRRAYALAVEDCVAETDSPINIKEAVDEKIQRVSIQQESIETVKDSAKDLKEDFQLMMDGKYSVDCVKTNLPQLDNMLGNGGIGYGEVMTLSAPTSCGKSALALHMGLKAAHKDAVPTLIFSLEMPRKQVVKRMIQTLSGANLRQIRERVINKEKMDKVDEAITTISELPLYTYHTIKSPQEMVNRTRDYVKRFGIKLVIIDYLQLIPWANNKKSKTEGISDISHKIKQMALELNISVLLLSQVNRTGAMRETGLSLYDLKDSGDIENDSDIVLLMWAKNGDIEGSKDTDSKGPYTNLQYNVAKNREGERGVGGYLTFYHCTGRFQ